MLVENRNTRTRIGTEVTTVIQMRFDSELELVEVIGSCTVGVYLEV